MKFIGLLLGIAATFPALAQVPVSGIETADRFVKELVDQDWKAGLRFTSREVRTQISPKELDEIWRHIVDEYGKFNTIQKADTQHTHTGFSATYRFLFERASFDLLVVLNHEDEIISFIFLPLQYQFPERMTGKVFSSERIVVQSDTFRMHGELMLPDTCDDCPVVVIVHGSGGIDRDLTFGPNKMYLDLAILLAEKGIATLRYDKRTYAYPNWQKKHLDSLTMDEITVTDVLQAIEVVRRHPITDSSPVFLLGHSLGAFAAPRIAALDSGLHGIILAAGPTMPLHHLIVYQFEFLFNLDGTMNRKEKKWLRKARKAVIQLDKGNYTYPGTKYLGPWGAAFWEDLLQYDPVGTVARLDIPAMVLFGARDYQVPPDSNADQWRALQDTSNEVQMIVYPSLNHMFMYGEGEPNRGEYLNPGHVNDQVISDIARWCYTVSARTKE